MIVGEISGPYQNLKGILLCFCLFPFSLLYFYLCLILTVAFVIAEILLFLTCTTFFATSPTSKATVTSWGCYSYSLLFCCPPFLWTLPPYKWNCSSIWPNTTLAPLPLGLRELSTSTSLADVPALPLFSFLAEAFSLGWCASIFAFLFFLHLFAMWVFNNTSWCPLPSAPSAIGSGQVESEPMPSPNI